MSIPLVYGYHRACLKVHPVSALSETLVGLVSTSRGLGIRDRRDRLSTTRQIDLPDGLAKLEYQADRHACGPAFNRGQTCAPFVRQSRQTYSLEFVTKTLYAKHAIYTCLLLLVQQHELSYDTGQYVPCHTLTHVWITNNPGLIGSYSAADFTTTLPARLCSSPRSPSEEQHTHLVQCK
jgi:hypothetical protein